MHHHHHHLLLVVDVVVVSPLSPPPEWYFVSENIAIYPYLTLYTHKTTQNPSSQREDTRKQTPTLIPKKWKMQKCKKM